MGVVASSPFLAQFRALLAGIHSCLHCSFALDLCKQASGINEQSFHKMMARHGEIFGARGPSELSALMHLYSLPFGISVGFRSFMFLAGFGSHQVGILRRIYHSSMKTAISRFGVLRRAHTCFSSRPTSTLCLY